MTKAVFTDVWNSGMRFVSNALCDQVKEADAPHSWRVVIPLLKDIEGRKVDVIRTPPGREFGAAVFTHLICGADHILESQIVQDTLDGVRVDYVPRENFNEHDLSVFRNLIEAHLPKELQVALNPVNTNPRTLVGKIKPLVSNLKG